MSKRDAIIDAAKELFWKQGYEKTSPKEIQSLANAGPGSFYHHFPTKKLLAEEVIRQTVLERLDTAKKALASDGDFFDRLDKFLGIASDALYGCKVGRMLWDSSVVKDETLRSPLSFYFTKLGDLLVDELVRAESNGEIWLSIPKIEIARMILAVVQGGFTLSRASQSYENSRDALKGLRSLLETSIRSDKHL